jgi:hypothetical protein
MASRKSSSVQSRPATATATARKPVPQEAEILGDLGLSGSERRRSPRVDLLGLVKGRLLTAGTEVVVRDLGIGGLATETPFPLDRGSIQDLRLTLGDGAAVDLRARVMHCRNIADPGEEPRYFTGFQFVDDDNAPVGDALKDTV